MNKNIRHDRRSGDGFKMKDAIMHKTNKLLTIHIAAAWALNTAIDSPTKPL